MERRVQSLADVLSAVYHFLQEQKVAQPIASGAPGSSFSSAAASVLSSLSPSPLSLLKRGRKGRKGGDGGGGGSGGSGLDAMDVSTETVRAGSAVEDGSVGSGVGGGGLDGVVRGLGVSGCGVGVGGVGVSGIGAGGGSGAGAGSGNGLARRGPFHAFSEKPPLTLLADADVVEALWSGKQSMMRRLLRKLETVYSEKCVVEVVEEEHVEQDVKEPRLGEGQETGEPGRRAGKEPRVSFS